MKFIKIILSAGIVFVSSSLTLTTTTTPVYAAASGSVVSDPVHTAQTVFQQVQDAAAYFEDNVLSVLRNLSKYANNSLELTEILTQLRDSEIDSEVVDELVDIVEEFTLGVVDLEFDIGDIDVNSGLLVEVLTERLAESMTFQRALSSRVVGFEDAIKDRFPEYELLFGDLVSDVVEDQFAFREELERNRLTTDYDTSLAVLRGNQQIHLGLKDSDDLLEGLRTASVNSELGENALLRRIMQGTLATAEYSRAATEAVTNLADLQAKDLLSRTHAKAVEAQWSQTKVGDSLVDKYEALVVPDNSPFQPVE